MRTMLENLYEVSGTEAYIAKLGSVCLASGAFRRYCVVTAERRWVEATNPSQMWALGAEGASSATGYLRSRYDLGGRFCVLRE